MNNTSSPFAAPPSHFTLPVAPRPGASGLPLASPAPDPLVAEVFPFLGFRQLLATTVADTRLALSTGFVAWLAVGLVAAAPLLAELIAAFVSSLRAGDEPGGWLSSPGAVLALEAVKAALAVIAGGAHCVVGWRVLDGNRVTWREAFAAALRRSGALLSVWSVGLIAIAVGFIAFVIPGLYLATALSLAVPAVMIEGRGTFAAFKRSWFVVRGSMISVFGILALCAGVAVSGFGVASAFVDSVTAAAVGHGAIAEQGARYLLPAGASLMMIPFGFLLSAATTSLFLRLRRANEGDDVARFEATFS